MTCVHCKRKLNEKGLCDDHCRQFHKMRDRKLKSRYRMVHCTGICGVCMKCKL